MKITAITGGIGSGKSVVSEMLRVMGYPVYDCDSKAKAIMNADQDIKALIAEKISPDVIDSEGNINRPRLSEIVFADPEKLAMLNTIVHGAVRDDLRQWADTRQTDRAWVETAILYESGIDKMVDDIWEIYAPEDIRIKRVMRRNALSAAQVKARIDSQQTNLSNRPVSRSSHADNDHPQALISPTIHRIVNDDLQPLLPQLLALL